MQARILPLLLSIVLVTPYSTAGAQEVPPRNCEHDRVRLLALDENQFDQDLNGGWRVLASRPGCTLAAADLLRDYRQAHRNDAGLMIWHEAQLRANAGQYPEAIALMKQAYKPAEKDLAGWNPYVDATIAFLRRDMAALKKARAKLAEVKAPVAEGMPPVIDGYVELDFADGAKRKIRWPPNIDVVEGLEKCFDKPYAKAYELACRQSMP